MAVLEKKQATFDNAFFDAIHTGDRDTMEWALTRGADIKFTRGGSERHTALMVAAMQGREELIDCLVEAKADPTATDSVARHCSDTDPFRTLTPNPRIVDTSTSAPLVQNWRTAMHWAGSQGATGVVARLTEWLGEAGVNVINKDQQSPLHRAAFRGHSATVQALLDATAQVDFVDSVNGWSAAHMAARQGHLEVLEVLHSAKANLTLRDQWQNSRSG